MHNTVKVPKILSTEPIIVDSIEVQAGDRVRQRQLLASLQVGNEVVTVVAPCDGWVRLVAVSEGSQVKRGDVLFVIDSMPAEDHRVDPKEVNPLKELGKDGRRGLMREGQLPFVESYAAALFDAPQAHQGNGHKMNSRFDSHPMMANVKEGVPLKQSADASLNQTAQEKFEEAVSNDPELRNNLSNELKARYTQQSTPSSAPTLKA